ncbi:unnamed protein product [Penicillium olsonii]|uniref:Nucleoside phosphorylase domain-containing protein n=1 Tax=Penicillium olsonii TaxID=99116 RepID=A0A9W4N072_PENOL|nr:unnamed protein product [Penicillium olsonii]
MCDIQGEVGPRLEEIVADVATAFVEAINHSRPASGSLHRSLKISLAHLVAEIKSIQVLYALTRRKSLEKALCEVAHSVERVLCGDYIKSRYQQLLEEEAKSRAHTLPFFLSYFITKSQEPSPPPDIQQANSPFPHVFTFRELFRRSDVRSLDPEGFLGRDERHLRDLIFSVKKWNSLVDELYDVDDVADDLEQTDGDCPRPPMVEIVFRREDNVRQMSQSLYNSLHANWPCQSEHHNHDGRLGLCLEAKFFLDPQWSSSEDLHDSLFMLLTGPDILQECRVCTSDYGVEQGSPACLIMHDDQSRGVCLYLTTDDEYQLWDKQRLARPLEVILAGEDYVEMSLTELQAIIKPTYAAKRVMGVTLARCILHLFEGPWLSGSMSIDDIYVYCKVQNSQPYPLFDKVFVATKFGPDDNKATQSRGYKIHPFPTILALGIMLLEIELGEDMLDIKSDPLYASKKHKPFYAAQHLLQEFRKRFNLDSGLVSAVTFCIDRASLSRFDTLDSEALLSNQQFIDTYYNKIVRPLEQDLVKGAHWTWGQVEQLQSPSFADAGICKVFTKGAVEVPHVSLGQNGDQIGLKDAALKSTAVGPKHHNQNGLQKASRPRMSQGNPPMPSLEETAVMSYKPIRSSDADTTLEDSSHCRPATCSNKPPNRPQQPRTRHDFTVAIICALRIEANAIEAIFEKYWEDDNGVYTYGKQPNDPNSYTAGLIGNHNVVLAHQPRMGKATAANVAAACSMSFPNIKLALIVGVCGGVPLPGGNTEILLGDVVISKGIVQYDFGRQYPGQFRRKSAYDDQPGRPDPRISSLLARLETNKHRANLQDQIAKDLNEREHNSDPRDRILYPGPAEDKLFDASYIHRHHTISNSCRECADEICDKAIDSTCDQLGCDQRRLVQRCRHNRHNQPVIHFGLIASGDTVLKSGAVRDKISRETKAIAFEMEGSGAWETIPCIIVKGVCDYADSHKNKLWQDYAAMTAAASAKAFLRHWTVNSSPDLCFN